MTGRGISADGAGLELPNVPRLFSDRAVAGKFPGACDDALLRPSVAVGVQLIDIVVGTEIRHQVG
jgi:hypothetical protein